MWIRIIKYIDRSIVQANSLQKQIVHGNLKMIEQGEAWEINTLSQEETNNKSEVFEKVNWEIPSEGGFNSCLCSIFQWFCHK